MIRLVDDIGAPALVTLLDTITVDKKPEWNRYIGIGVSAAGYMFGGYMGMSNFMKQVGVASFPWAAQSIYQLVKGSAPTRVYRNASAGVARRISRYPAPSAFGGLKLD